LEQLVDLAGQRGALAGAQRVARALRREGLRALHHRGEAAQRAIGLGELGDRVLDVGRLLGRRVDRDVQLQVLGDLARIVARRVELLAAGELRSLFGIERGLFVDRRRLLRVDRRGCDTHRAAPFSYASVGMRPIAVVSSVSITLSVLAAA